MSKDLETTVKEICTACNNDPTRMMDIVRQVQAQSGCVSSQAMDLIAGATGAQRVEVEGVVTFYAFLSQQCKGKIVIRLCDDIIDRFSGLADVEKALTEALGVSVGQTTDDGRFTLEHTPCIGMSDQAPAAMVNDVIVTNLDADRARKMVAELKHHGDPQKLVAKFGDGNNGNPLVKSMVENNIRERGEVLFGQMTPGAGLKNALAMSPAEVIRDVKTARLRGRGGAGFPTGMKWDFTRGATGTERYVVCNADEGEPGTFKDRVLLTETPDLLFEGMTVAGYAIGGQTGILYLRAEYAYLEAFLEDVLAKRRQQGLLGQNVCGKDGFNFDIRIQMGAGAYICGEETALLSSCEGRRGDPKTRPPFPAQKGYLGKPTTVNNVETFCCAARILEKGPGWFAQMGSKGSPGTKLLSICGDCKRPGVYELPFGVCLNEILEMCGADDVQAVQLGGPSGRMVAPADFSKTICYDDIATGGSMMIFDSSRDLLEVVDYFMDFFIEESCGYCTPCRVGTRLVKQRLEAIREGKGEPGDLDYLRDLGNTMTRASRCGLGQTASRPVTTTLEAFGQLYETLIAQPQDVLRPRFDMAGALVEAEAIAGRKSTFLHE